MLAKRLVSLPALLALCLLLAPPGAKAAEMRQFVAGSLARIAAERVGKPFILAFWSVTCTHCPTELKALGALKKSNPGLDIVLVAADSPDEAPLAAELAVKYGLAGVEQWVFADTLPERLRYEIDPAWRGELPRTHFYDRRHGLEAVAGVVPAARLARWVKEQTR